MTPSIATARPGPRIYRQTGDKTRATVSLAYQLVVDTLLVAILALESLFDKTEWLGDDVMKKLNSTDASCLKLWEAPNIEDKGDVAPAWWNDWGALSFGCLGALLAVEAEILVVGEELRG